jgi:2-hydroxy-6-oxonona-2,4-dienedioate hydrolase
VRSEVAALDLRPDGRGPEGRYVEADGLRYHLIELGAGPPLVFLHGGGPGCTGWTDFGPVAPRFAHDRRVILVDLLQYGRSDKPAIAGPMWDFHATHLLALFDALGLDRPDLVCNSWGGTQALCLAADHPSRVGRLVITGSMPVFHGPMSPLLDRSRRGRIAREEYYGGAGPSWEKMRHLMARFEWFDADAIPEATVDLRYRQSLDPDEVACGQVPANRGEWQDLSGHLPRVVAPTLFVWGMYDAFLTPDYALMLASGMERGNLFVMDRAGHHLQEERPAEYHAVVAAFLV